MTSVRAPGWAWAPAVVVWALVLAAGLYAGVLRSHEVKTPNGADLGRIPASTASWEGSDVRFDARIYQVLSADTTLMRHYQEPGSNGDFWLFVAYFHSQRTGAQIHSPKNCLPGGGWNIVGREAVELPLGGRPVRVNRFLIARGEDRQAVYYWFMTRAGVIDDEYALKVDLVRNALLRRPTDAAFVRLSGPVLSGGLAETDRSAARLLAALSGSLVRALPFPPEEAF